MGKEDKKPETIKYDPDLLDQFFDPLVNPERYEYEEGVRIKRSIEKAPQRIKIDAIRIGPGAPKKASDEEIKSIAERCIRNEKIETELGPYDFITSTGETPGKVQPTTIAKYILNHTEIGKHYSGHKQLSRIVKRVLSGISIVEKRENIYMKKGHKG